jgi:predicted RNA-binding protein YlxR (DUF448 family)
MTEKKKVTAWEACQMIMDDITKELKRLMNEKKAAQKLGGINKPIWLFESRDWVPFTYQDFISHAREYKFYYRRGMKLSFRNADGHRIWVHLQKEQFEDMRKRKKINRQLTAALEF